MELLIEELKRALGISLLIDSVWVLRRQLASIQGNLSSVLQTLLRLEKMAPEVKELLDQIRVDIANEKEEVKTAIEQSVSKAIAPLQETISQLETQIAEGQDPTETLNDLREIANEVKSIVSLEEPTEEPIEEPVEEVTEESAEESSL